MKRCIACEQPKEQSFFSKNRARPDGLNQRCKPCDAARNRARRLAMPEVHRGYTKSWAGRNPEQAAKHDKDSRWRRLEKKFGMTREQYERMLAAQGGVCAICLGGPRGRKQYLSVDHDHETGEVRGLLCDPCNRALGLIGDDPDKLTRAIEHLSAPGWTALRERELSA